MQGESLAVGVPQRDADREQSGPPHLLPSSTSAVARHFDLRTLSPVSALLRDPHEPLKDTHALDDHRRDSDAHLDEPSSGGHLQSLSTSPSPDNLSRDGSVDQVLVARPAERIERSSGPNSERVLDNFDLQSQSTSLCTPTVMFVEDGHADLLHDESVHRDADRGGHPEIHPPAAPSLSLSGAVQMDDAGLSASAVIPLTSSSPGEELDVPRSTLSLVLPLPRTPHDRDAPEGDHLDVLVDSAGRDLEAGLYMPSPEDAHLTSM